MVDELGIVRRDCVGLLKPRNVETVWVMGEEPYDWVADLAQDGFLPNTAYHPGYDAVVAPLNLDGMSRRDVMISIDQMAEATKRGGLAFALFGPYDPQKPTFKDNELRAIFSSAFKVELFRSYPGGRRGLLLKRLACV